MRTALGCCALFVALNLLPASAAAEKIVLVAGGGQGGDGSAAKDFKFVEPFGVAFDKAGHMYVVELSGQRVLRMDAKGIITTFAGTLQKKGHEGDGGPAAKALFNGPHSIVIAPNDDMYIADTWNSCVRKIDAKTGTVSTVAGTGKKGFSGDGGPAVKAQLGNVYHAALDPKGERLYLADLDNRRIRMVQLDTGIVTTVAGNGEKGVPQDGAIAKEAPLVDPRAVAADAKGNVWVLERGGHALRVVDAAGKIRTVAGTGKAGGTGDGGDAKQATLNGPKHLCVDPDGNIIIADAESNLVRKYVPADGKLLRVAGTGTKGAAGLDGPPEKAGVARPHGVTVHPSGVLYITDSYNNRILRIEK